jgi:hypothetical protein
MKWVTAKSKLPRDGQEVLIRNNEVYHVAVFNEPGNCFVLRDGRKINISDTVIQWTTISPPAR